MEPSGERSVKPKVTMEYRNSENLEEFIKEFKEIYLEIDMNKKDAEEELEETQQGSKESSSQVDLPGWLARMGLLSWKRRKKLFGSGVGRALQYRKPS